MKNDSAQASGLGHCAWLEEAIRLVREYAMASGALDVAHVMGDARFYDQELPSEKAAWNAVLSHLKLGTTHRR